MELHTTRIVLLIVVAVDTLSLTVLATKGVVVNDRLIVVLEAALVDGQHLVSHEGRRDETIADIRIDGIGRHMNGEGLVAGPLAPSLRKDLDQKVATLSSSKQLTPFGKGWGLTRRGRKHWGWCLAGGTSKHGIVGNHGVNRSIDHESEGCDVDRNGDINIVGINLRERIHLGVLRRDGNAGAGGYQPKAAHEAYEAHGANEANEV